ncbi:MAG: phage portal protein [Chloroflexi bacterium]|nr:MAG: phage portal protein [Chloroflexota bacterium]
MRRPGFLFLYLVKMGIFQRLLNSGQPQNGSQPESGGVEASPWLNPAWWGGAASSTAGIVIDQDAALKISTVYACVSLISETIASLPLFVYRYLADGGRVRAVNHPLYELLHDQPNSTQTSFEFRQMMMTHALMRGSGYARIVPGERGFVNELVPIHPDNVRKEALGNGRFRYVIRDDDGVERPYLPDEIFEIGGMSLDGMNTVSVVSHARDSFGLAIAAERYGSKFYKNDSRPGGILTTDGKLTAEAAARLRASWQAAHSGDNQWRVAVLENGLRWQQIGVTPDEAQFLQSREFQAEDICRWFRVPPHMVGLTSKATSWGSGIEQQSIGFVTYTLRPWLVRCQQAIARDLILARDRYFVDFVVEGLLRGDIGSRYNAYAIARQWGWMSVNEIRRLENLNPIENGDRYLEPLNMTEAGQNAALASHHMMLIEEAAARLVRREVAALTRAKNKCTGDDNGTAWETAVADFYREHVRLVAETMRIPETVAREYCQAQTAQVLAHGVESLDMTALCHVVRAVLVDDEVNENETNSE